MNKREILKRAKSDKSFRYQMIRKLSSSRTISSRHIDTDFLLWDGNWGRNGRYMDADDDVEWMGRQKMTQDDFYVMRFNRPPLDLSAVYFTDPADLVAFLERLQKNLGYTIQKAKKIRVV